MALNFIGEKHVSLPLKCVTLILSHKCCKANLWQVFIEFKSLKGTPLRYMNLNFFHRSAGVLKTARYSIDNKEVYSEIDRKSYLCAILCPFFVFFLQN
jgi:hypothetical protein